MHGWGERQGSTHQDTVSFVKAACIGHGPDQFELGAGGGDGASAKEEEREEEFLKLHL